MKDYQITKIWAERIAEISESIDKQIEYMENQLDEKFAEDTAEMDDLEKKWRQESIDFLQERIKCCTWCLNQINAPFKIKK